MGSLQWARRCLRFGSRSPPLCACALPTDVLLRRSCNLDRSAPPSTMPSTTDVAIQVHLNEVSPVKCRDVEVYFLAIP